jgi:hypothetical protein
MRIFGWERVKSASVLAGLPEPVPDEVVEDNSLREAILALAGDIDLLRTNLARVERKVYRDKGKDNGADEVLPDVPTPPPQFRSGDFVDLSQFGGV